MYGIVQIGGHQYRVSPGDIIDVQKLNQEEGKTLQLDNVLFVGGENPQLGTPSVEGAQITAQIIRNARSRKMIVFKDRRGAWRKKNGHRQHYTSLLITEIKDGNGTSKKIDNDSKESKKYLK